MCGGFVVSNCSDLFFFNYYYLSWQCKFQAVDIIVLRFPLHCRLQLITAELAVLVLVEPWCWGLLPLSGARIKRELVLQTAEERYRIEFPSVLLGDPVFILCFHVLLMSSPEFLIQSNRLTLSWVIAENHRCVLLADWKIGVSADWSFSSLWIISWDMMNVWKSSAKIPGQEQQLGRLLL